MANSLPRVGSDEALADLEDTTSATVVGYCEGRQRTGASVLVRCCSVAAPLVAYALVLVAVVLDLVAVVLVAIVLELVAVVLGLVAVVPGLGLDAVVLVLVAVVLDAVLVLVSMTPQPHPGGDGGKGTRHEAR